MKARWIYTLTLICSVGYANADAQPNKSVSRGELLYATHCIGCHSDKLHWRDERLAQDWNSLSLQIDRWQRNAGLKWSEDDIAEVARYLNSSHYHFIEPLE